MSKRSLLEDHERHTALGTLRRTVHHSNSDKKVKVITESVTDCIRAGCKSTFQPGWAFELVVEIKWTELTNLLALMILFAVSLMIVVIQNQGQNSLG